MKLTKLTLIAAGLLASATAFSAPNPASFQTIQAAQIAHIQASIQIEQQLLSCVQAAQDHNAIKACHDTAKAARQALKAPVATPAPGQ